MLLHFFEDNCTVKVSFKKRKLLSNITSNVENDDSDVDSYENSCSEKSLRFASPRVAQSSSPISDSDCRSSDECQSESEIENESLSCSSSTESNENSSPWKPTTESQENFSHSENSDSSYLPERNKTRHNKRYRNKQINRNGRRCARIDSESDSNYESDYSDGPKRKRRNVAKRKKFLLSSEDETRFSSKRNVVKKKQPLKNETASADLVCQYCFKFFTRESALKGHLLLCAENEANCSPMKYGLDPSEVSPAKKIKCSTFSIPKPHSVITVDSQEATNSIREKCPVKLATKKKVDSSDQSASSKENNSKSEDEFSDNLVDCELVCPHCSKTFANLGALNVHFIMCPANDKQTTVCDSNSRILTDCSPEKLPNRTKWSKSCSSKLNSMSSPVGEPQSPSERFRRKRRKRRCHIAESSSEEANLARCSDKVKTNLSSTADLNNVYESETNNKKIFTDQVANCSSSEIQNISKTGKYHNCFICTLQVEKGAPLMKHMRTHMNEADLSCKRNRRSVKETKLKVELKKEFKQESEEPNHPKSQTVVNPSSRILNRLSLKHSKFQPTTSLTEFRCRKCRKTFHRSAAYESHKRSH